MKQCIGIDIDSVICNIEDGVCDFIKNNGHPEFKLDNLVDFKIYNNKHLLRECREALMSVLVSPEFLFNGVVYPGVKEAMEYFNKIFNVHLVTGRYEDTLKIPTLNWLKNNGISFTKVHFTNMKSKLDIINEFNMVAFVEDNPYEIKGILDNIGNMSYGIYCVERPWNRNMIDARVYRVKGLKEAANIILNSVWR